MNIDAVTVTVSAVAQVLSAGVTAAVAAAEQVVAGSASWRMVAWRVNASSQQLTLPPSLPAQHASPMPHELMNG